MKVLYSLSLLFFSLFSFASSAQTFSSNDKQVQLIELYTSEGCSSCPPADRWLNNLKQHQGLWSEFIPLAFHVDYWDYIGWKDPFAQKLFSQRQRQLAINKTLSSVYTPAVLINSTETSAWRHSALPKPVQAKSVGKLALDVNDNITATYTPTITTPSNLILNVATLKMDITVAVKAGENNGRTLHHDFVVVDFKQVAMSHDANNQFYASIDKAAVLGSDKSEHALVAWVSDKNLTSLQATGGLLN